MRKRIRCDVLPAPPAGDSRRVRPASGAPLPAARARSQSRVTGLAAILVVAVVATYFGVRQPVQVAKVLSGVDANDNGIDDMQDVVEGARLQVESRPAYKSAYYEGGYPPENEGVCTDLVWRALWDAGYDLKVSVDLDIAEAVEEYPRVGGSPDPNIDFRRVPNLFVFLSRTAETLTTKVKPWDADNASEWQPGDVVVFGKTHDHIGIVSDIRRRDGIPLVIHHGGRRPVENNALRSRNQVTGHFRLDLSRLGVANRVLPARNKGTTPGVQ